MNETLEQFVTRTGKMLEIRVSAVPAGTACWWTIDNYSRDGVPLDGWTWDDPAIDTFGATLEDAWRAFALRMLAKGEA